MFEFLGRFEEVVGDLYPYRWLVSIAAIVVMVTFVGLAMRLRWHHTLWNHRAMTAAIATPALVVLALFASYTLPPLWERSRLDESSPLAIATPDAVESETPAADLGAPSDSADAVVDDTGTSPDAFMARITHRGMFEGADDFHFGRGDALLIETARGMYTLRFENFSVRNGPDLFVYLTDDPNDVSTAVNLGDLKATDGNFNYEIPPDVDPSAYRYAIVWCRDFAVLFATAPLEMV